MDPRELEHKIILQFKKEQVEYVHNLLHHDEISEDDFDIRLQFILNAKDFSDIGYYITQIEGFDVKHPGMIENYIHSLREKIN
jgi:hypothetical protein